MNKVFQNLLKLPRDRQDLIIRLAAKRLLQNMNDAKNLGRQPRKDKGKIMPNNQVSLIVTPLRSAMLAGHANKVHVLVRVQAPDLPENKKQQRQPYGIGFVIDRSGSMAGVPLKEAVRCVRFMSDKLTDRDFASLVTFDSNVALEFPLSPMTERSDLNEALAEVTAGGQTGLPPI